MYVVVIGLGEVGRHVIRTLEWERHDLVAIDHDAEAVARIEEYHDVMSLVGYGASQQTLSKAEVQQADLVVAVTNHDEVNLIAALAARQLGAKKVIARVQGQNWTMGEEQGVYYGLLGVDVVINPRVLIAQEVAKIARSHGALEVVDLADNRIELVQVKLSPHCRMLHKPLSKLSLPKDTLVAAIVRDGRLSVPGGADVLLANDRIYLIGRSSSMIDAEDLFSTQREARRIFIVGGGVIGQALSRILLNDGAEVTLLEQSRVRAQQLAAELDKVTVVHGDGTQLDQLINEHIERFDLFVAVTNEDEVNLMSCLLAKRAGADRTVCLAHRPDYSEIYRQLGIDIVLSPRILASEQILRFCRQSDVKGLTMLEEGQAEVIELEAMSGSRAVGVPIHRMNVPRGALLAAIVHDGQIIIPRGKDMIHAGDTVIVLTTVAARRGVTRLFRQRLL